MLLLLDCIFMWGPLKHLAGATGWGRTRGKWMGRWRVEWHGVLRECRRSSRYSDVRQQFPVRLIIRQILSRTDNRIRFQGMLSCLLVRHKISATCNYLPPLS